MSHAKMHRDGTMWVNAHGRDLPRMRDPRGLTLPELEIALQNRIASNAAYQHTALPLEILEELARQFSPTLTAE